MRRLLPLPLLLLLAACASTPPAGSVVPVCPATPNCAVRLFSVADPAAAWAALPGVLDARAGTTLTASGPDEVRATARTATLGFTDDLLFVRTADGIAMRSASRLGLWDLGTNARRLAAIAAAIEARLDG